jgi:pyruvate-formate lyase
METPTAHRLSPVTHQLATRAKAGEWGRALVDLPLHVESIPGWELMSQEMRYAHGIRLIADNAPLRITPGELLVGAATLYGATLHRLPLRFQNEFAFYSVSHLTCGFDHVMQVGYDGLRAQVQARLAKGDLDEKGQDLLSAMLICLDAADAWHARYLGELDQLIANSTGADRAAYEALRDNMVAVPAAPPSTFREAVQSFWTMFCFHHLCGTWCGLGRIDAILGPFLAQDLAAGRITLDEARELIAHFWIKGAEWAGCHDGSGASGDAQFYQNIVLAGVDADGREITNDVTYLVLDVIEELRISDFPIAVRLSPDSPARLVRRVAEVQRQGGGIVAVYNEPVIIRSLIAMGYSEREARRFTNDGCWEPQVPGETCFIYEPIDLLGMLQEVLGVIGEGAPAVFESFDALYAAFKARVDAYIANFHTRADGYAAGGPPSAWVSLFVKDCIEKGRGYYERGARYNTYAPHAGGVADVANSLLAIKKLVYEEGRIGLPELVACLRADWCGHEDLRQYALHHILYYGNDDAEADAMAAQVLDDFLAAVETFRERNGVLRPAGVSTFGREIGWRHDRGATAFGRHVGDILATNLSPSPGTDRDGPTAVIDSYCKMPHTRLPSGTSLEIKLLPESVQGEAGLQAVEGLLRGFICLGGSYLAIDAIDSALLREAQIHPEDHTNLSVRVSGWAARFVILGRDWQEMIINRTQQK